MGCTAAKDEISKEEHCLLDGEDSLLYSLKNCKDIDSVHRKYSYQKKINKFQFKEIAARLNLAVHLNPTEKLNTFYDNFKVDQDHYSLKKLLILGLLISSGNTVDKARMLFEIEDKLSEKVLKKARIQKIVGKITWVSLEILPSFYEIEEQKYSEDGIDRYVKKISGNMQRINEILVKEFMGGDFEEISLLDFVNNFRVDETAKLLRPHFLRKFAIQCGREIEETRIIN